MIDKIRNGLVGLLRRVFTLKTFRYATSVSADSNSATVSGTVTVSATSSDNVGVTKMEVYIDGALKTSNTNSTSISYSWNTTGVSNGSHTIQSKAYDAAGNVGTSPTFTVTVSNGGTTTELISNNGFEGIVNLSGDRGKCPPFVALRKAQSPTCSGSIREILFKLTIPSVGRKTTSKQAAWQTSEMISHVPSTVARIVVTTCSHGVAWSSRASGFLLHLLIHIIQCN
jgi:hypothetical protein